MFFVLRGENLNKKIVFPDFFSLLIPHCQALFFVIFSFFSLIFLSNEQVQQSILPKKEFIGTKKFLAEGRGDKKT